jgi:glycerate kinase
MSRIVIAPDSFKGSATSSEVASAIAAGWHSARPDDELIQIPFADGGEGTLLAIERANPGAQRIYCPDISREAYWLLVDESTAIVELAQVSGLTLLQRLDPMGAHTFDFGQVLGSAAKDSRVVQIYCALGGSASTDAGVGALMALGVKFLDSSGVPVGLGGGQLLNIESISSIGAVPAPKGGVTLLVDVQAQLCGNNGAASMYSPQKGATADQTTNLESALSHFLTISGFPDGPGNGAAGGTAFGLSALWGATIESGAEKIAQLCGLDAAMLGADLIITGEGRLDNQSFDGKAVGFISKRAQAESIAIAYCVGSVVGDFPAESLGGVSLSEIAGCSELAMRNPEQYLFQAGVQLAHVL